MKLLYDRQPVEEVLADLGQGALNADDAALKRQLQLSQEMLLFAETDIGLPVGARYRSYVELSEPNVVWNLFAAPELSLLARTWCYPFIDSAPYRGYFDLPRAKAYRDTLEEEGFEKSFRKRGRKSKIYTKKSRAYCQSYTDQKSR